MTWENAIENYKTYLILEKSLSPNSVEAYLNDIRKLAKYCKEDYSIKKIEDVTYDILKDYIIFVNETGITNRTQARSISSVRSFFKFLVYDGVLEVNPSKLLETPKIGRKLPSVLTVEEIDSILRAVEMYKPEGQRNKAIIETLYSCGLRVSELISLKISNINFRTSIIKVEGKGNRERIIPLSKNAKQEIKLYMKGFRSYLDIENGYEDTLFLNKRGTALSRVMVFNIIKHLTNRAGVKKPVSPHTFRHSFASHLVSGGADLRAVQDMLGHESILTTEIYTHLDNNYLRDTINKYHPRIKDSEEEKPAKGSKKK
ncbi:site-specific tyrosine recombinase XerD [Porphyromonadaceae bacterium OttesenSCG-928-L07]|nr:site-specific tyrosine recombinase XerD [Porphyromonadaceae bacterium OttesenSCG-928-L07]MDL2252049.1 site-specific tyrosine recombinase XerD [Odoribacter sp. OttesenSCG-928-J03]